MNPTPDNPYGLERPSFPPSQPPVMWAPPGPVAAQGAPAPGAAPAPMATPPVQVDQRLRVGAIVLLVSAAAMLLGIASYSWFQQGRSGVGLLGVERCFDGQCRSMSWGDIPRAPGEYAMFSYLGLFSLLASIGLSVHAGVMMLRGMAHKAQTRLLNIALGLAAFSTVSFVFRMLTDGKTGHGLHIGYASIVTVTAVIAAGTVAHRILRKVAQA